MNKKIITLSTVLMLVLCQFQPIHASKIEEQKPIMNDAQVEMEKDVKKVKEKKSDGKAVKEGKKDNKKEDKVTSGDEKQDEAVKNAQENAGMEQIYPVVISLNENDGTLDYVSAETLDKLYKVIGDNQDKTYQSISAFGAIAFDDQHTYKLTPELKSEIKKVVTKDNMPNTYKLFKYSDTTLNKTKTTQENWGVLPLVSAVFIGTFLAELAFKGIENKNKKNSEENK